ncbi:MAG: hypothetical protein Q8807_03345 ['Waltheria sp.' little leaf phytoplasma]|nr:hypothetical protein ['Waltheria sp.' little leaf phytoplasma]
MKPNLEGGVEFRVNNAVKAGESVIANDDGNKKKKQQHGEE